MTPDYARFQLWDSIQAVCSYVRGILTSQAMLAGVGVGQQAATPLSAVFQFFLRDLSGMLGGIGFAFFQGAKLDVYAKQWRLFADCLNNVGLALELASPAFPSMFLAMACLGSIARAITGVAGGSTRAALTLHFAKKNNAADISAKEGTQETATTLIGMLVGMGLTRCLQGSAVLLWITFLSLTVLHVYANIRAMRSLVLSSLNPSRLQLLVDTFYSQGNLMSPANMAQVEPLAPPPVQKLLAQAAGQGPSVVMGASLLHLAAMSRMSTQALCQTASDQPYILSFCQEQVHVVLSRDISPRDSIKAFVHAQILCRRLCSCSSSEQMHEAEHDAKLWIQSNWEKFLELLKAGGWDLTKVSLAQSNSSAVWGSNLHRHND